MHFTANEELDMWMQTGLETHRSHLVLPAERHALVRGE